MLIPFSGRRICDAACKLGEGITYDAAADIGWWFDIEGRRLHAWHVTSGTKLDYDTPFMGSALASIDADRQLVVADVGLMIRDVKQDSYSRYRVIDDNPRTRSNDSRVHRSGAIWTSRMGRQGEAGLGAIYHVDRSGTKLLFQNLSIPNGICFSPDGTIAYFADSRTNRFMRVQIEAETGLPTAEPTLLSDETGSAGCIDGAICDADGLIWCARWGGGTIDVYTPEGRKLRRYAVPVPQVTCPAFVGPHADRILATTAWQGMDAEERSVHPHSGCTFEIAAPVRGRLEPAFIL